MATIKFVDSAACEFVTAREMAESNPKIAAQLADMQPEAADMESYVHHAGTDEEPELIEVRMPPNVKIEAHAHPVNEILVVTAGEAIFGKRTYGVGSSVFVPAMTLYSFRSGPNGLTYMNFRPFRSVGSFTKEQMMAEREKDLSVR